MAQGINFNITQNAGCASLVFKDTSNYATVGYGDLSKTVLVFNLSNGETITFTNFLPTADSQSFTIYAIDLGYGDVDAVIPDQITTVTYTVYDIYGNVLGTKSTPVLLSCNFVSCFFGQVAQAAANFGKCDQADLTRLSNMWIRFVGLQASVENNAGCMTGQIEELGFECSKFCWNNCGNNNCV